MPIFSPDSKRLAYTARSDRGNGFVVVDGKEGKIYDDVHRPIFSSDSKRVAYVATSGDKYFVVVDGNEGKKYVLPNYPSNSFATFSPDSKHVA